MKYLCLIYLPEALLERLSPAELDALRGAGRAPDRTRTHGAGCLGGELLGPAGSALTLRRRAGGLSLTDGPAVETPEPLCGFVLIEARDLDEAIALAAANPAARMGSIEVRPVNELAPCTLVRVPETAGEGVLAMDTCRFSRSPLD